MVRQIQKINLAVVTIIVKRIRRTKTATTKTATTKTATTITTITATKIITKITIMPTQMTVGQIFIKMMA
ncbi:MAG: hypothetical protein KH047_06795 [Eubacterium sp.]|nr:hypothetical protein [Eubacterium sp.]